MSERDECEEGGHLWRDAPPGSFGVATYAEQVCERCPAYRDAPDWT